MGYSAATPLKSAKAHAEMRAFSARHFQPWHKIAPEEGWNPDFDWTGCPQADLSYDHGKNRLGFDFSTSGGLIGEYGFALLRWMALRGGRTRPLKKYTGTDEAVPYMVYDGHEAWPVLVRSEWESRVPDKGEWCLTDEDGWQPVRREWIPPRARGGDVERAIIIPDISNQMVLSRLLLKFGATKEQITEFFNEDPPHRVESFEPTSLLYLGDALKKADIAHEFEYGPFVLSGERKELSDAEEPRYLKAEQIIKDELTRLSALWEQREAP